MRKLDEILEEVEKQATKDNCQSWNSICLTAMEQAVKERKAEIIEQLEKISDNYEVIDGCYIIQKTILDDYTYNLELELF
jgi:hypothetical protein